MQTNNDVQLEYRVREVTRYIVTRYTSLDPNATATVEGRGEYDNPEVAFEVAYALCRREHEALGWPPGDMRIRYPNQFGGSEKAIGIP